MRVHILRSGFSFCNCWCPRLPDGDKWIGFNDPILDLVLEDEAVEFCRVCVAEYEKWEGEPDHA